MSIISTILVIVVAVEALGIMGLEMFGSQTATAAKVFDFSAEYQSRPETKTTMANIGLYNGFVGVGLLIMRFMLPENAVLLGCLVFTGFVVIAGIYGAITVNRQIALTQGLPALLAFLSLMILG
ncbi:DUF1304 domain-containing protein [Secundilactobacillus folii]|uniref:DUF1304 family protein n=1 Tax=Secundilactobacillus folii TaxID=2678357 RepID=A0A7X2XWX8_9LACO|nr:DUF1304 domain-containing protein [Secundilactobacillus folii]MTV83167.1 DUF1304 family protein [Secundilactobacillus folii]